MDELRFNKVFAGFLFAALLLMAMGYPVLSMNSPNLLLVKKALTSFPMSDAEQLLADVLALDSAQAVKQATDQALAEAGLSQLIRVRR